MRVVRNPEPPRRALLIIDAAPTRCAAPRFGATGRGVRVPSGARDAIFTGWGVRF